MARTPRKKAGGPVTPAESLPPASSAPSAGAASPTADGAVPTPAAAATPAASPAPAPAIPAGTLGLAEPGGQGKVYTSPPVRIDFAGPEHRVNRVDLELDGLYHGEASYEGRVFFNNPAATGETTTTQENGYAGSFYIFGHGGCLGDPGHCEVRDEREPYDFRPGHPLSLTRRRVNVTKTLTAIAAAKPEVTVTIVPVITAANELCDKVNVLRFEGMRFVSYDP